MIFNFFNQIFRRTNFWESVTERKLPVQLWNFHQGSYTPQEHHPSDRIFGQMPECDFFFFLLYFRNSGYYTWSNPHQLPRETLWRGRVRTWVWFLPPTSVGIVTENPLTGRKANKCLKVLRSINNNTKHSALMILQIFNPLNHTWAISRPPRGHQRCFCPNQPFCQDEDYFAYFELAESLSKSSKCSELKSNSPFLGDVRLIKVVSEFSFGHWKGHIFVSKHGHFCQKCPSLHAQKGISGTRTKILRPLL